MQKLKNEELKYISNIVKCMLTVLLLDVQTTSISWKSYVDSALTYVYIAIMIAYIVLTEIITYKLKKYNAIEKRDVIIINAAFVSAFVLNKYPVAVSLIIYLPIMYLCYKLNKYISTNDIIECFMGSYIYSLIIAIIATTFNWCTIVNSERSTLFGYSINEGYGTYNNLGMIIYMLIITYWYLNNDKFTNIKNIISLYLFGTTIIYFATGSRTATMCTIITCALVAMPVINNNCKNKNIKKIYSIYEKCVRYVPLAMFLLSCVMTSYCYEIRYYILNSNGGSFMARFTYAYEAIANSAVTLLGGSNQWTNDNAYMRTIAQNGVLITTIMVIAMHMYCDNKSESKYKIENIQILLIATAIYMTMERFVVYTMYSWIMFIVVLNAIEYINQTNNKRRLKNA